jgi:iron complex outermembrane receptor protein
LTNLHLQFPTIANDRLATSVRFYYDWRQDAFLDLAREIGLAQQDNQDTTQDFGTQVLLEARLPLVQSVSAFAHVRQETFDPSRRFAPDQESQRSRSVAELALSDRLSTLDGRLALQGTLRFLQESDHFTDVPANATMPSASSSTDRQFVEPHAGLRMRLLRGLFAECSYGELHRSPTFMELFGDQGIIKGNPQLVPEEGINRDVGLEWSSGVGGLQWHFEAAHYRNRVDHLILFVVQSQRQFIARNIDSARMEGEEYTWNVGFVRSRARVNVQGNLTRQRTRDLGVDNTVYADKILPGRPASQAFGRLTLGWSRYDVSWQVEHLGRNYLDRFNLFFVAPSTRHGIDASVRIHTLRFKGAVRNLTDNRDVDALKYPLPGRAYSLMTDITF